MSAAACAAKIRIDGGRLMRGINALRDQVQEILDEVERDYDEEESEFRSFTPEQQKKMEALSQHFCEWGNANFKWGDFAFKESSAILTNGGNIYSDETGTHTEPGGGG